MQTVQELAEEIVAREGGFVNDPADPGGATNHGITLNTLRRLGLDVTRDKRIDVSDVHALTQSQAVAIFVEYYYNRPGISALPEVLRPCLFDMYVNAGANAVKVLQRLVTGMGFDCVDDGAIGPETIQAVRMAFDAAPVHLADAYAIARRNFYYALCDARPASRKFACRRDGGKGGWIVRAEEFMSERYRLTDAQHKARTAEWA